jgi:two-component system, chemotaxis family, protein-glutamate methylesterase/glutaminase
VNEGELLRFRCRVGHAYTANALRVAMSEATEDALWAAMRALEEKAALMRRMAPRSALRLAGAYEEEAQTYDKHAESIRGILSEGQKAA